MNWAMLDGVPEAQRTLVLRAAQRRRYRKGAFIFHEGEPGDSLHLIERGRVAVLITTPEGDAVILNLLGPGEVCGELALVMPGSRRTASVEALEPTETLVLQRATFEELTRRHPSTLAVMVALLAHRVEALSAQVLEALYVSAEVRVLRRVLRLAGLYGSAPPVTIPMTQQSLATMAGTTRPTANKALREAEQAGIVKLGRGQVVVLDLEGLRSAAR